MSTPKFANTHNLVAFLKKPEESNGFKEIINFLNSNQIRYALTVNPTIYTSCIEQFWATAKVKTVNEERQLQALVDKKKVIITKTSIRSDLNLEDAGGSDCLLTDTIFKDLARMSAKTNAWNEFSSTMASVIICLATNQKFNLSSQQLGDMSHHKKTYVNPSHIKKIFANMKREGKDFSGRITPMFATMMVHANQEEGVDSDIPTDSQQTPITTQPSTSKPQKKKSRRKQRKDIKVSQSNASTKPMTEKETNKESVPTHSYDPSQSGEDRMQLHELMNLCTKLSDRVLALETTKTTQALEIASLKSKVKKLEKKASNRTHKFKRLYRDGTTRRVESYNDVSLGAQEDASKQGRKIADLDADAEVTLVDETQEMNDDNLMFDTVTTAGEVVTTANVEVTTVNAPTTTIVSLKNIESNNGSSYLAFGLLMCLCGVSGNMILFQDLSKYHNSCLLKTNFASLQSQLTQAKDKGKGVIVEPEVPLKKKDQIAIDEEVARNLEAQPQAELEEEERISRLKEEKANIALLESWDNTQAIMDVDFQLAQQRTRTVEY
ncbi:hypothetical protein Tco_1218112 [Tanacetum coccineum]